MRLLVADHNACSLWGLRTALQEEAGFDMVGEAVDAIQLLELAGELSPELVLVDRRLPGSHLGDMVASLRALKPRPFVVVMSSASEDSRMALRAGADAFVSKGDQPQWLMSTLRRYAAQVETRRGLT